MRLCGRASDASLLLIVATIERARLHCSRRPLSQLVSRFGNSMLAQVTKSQMDGKQMPKRIWENGRRPQRLIEVSQVRRSLGFQTPLCNAGNSVLPSDNGQSSKNRL